MSQVPKGRKIERAAVNALRSLLERHEHIIQDIDGGNDFGEDLYLDFTENGHRTGDTVRVQVKGGKSHRAQGGYRVRVGHHETDWAEGNVPVLCVVYDPRDEALRWTNATRQIHESRRVRKNVKSIFLPAEELLTDATVNTFAREVRRYVGRYRGNRAIETKLAEMAGVTFEPSDKVEHFRNELGEDLIFCQRWGERSAILLHSDLDWEPQEITSGMLDFDGLRKYIVDYRLHSETARTCTGVPTIADIVIDMPEALWLAACFSATAWMREDRITYSGEQNRPVKLPNPQNY